SGAFQMASFSATVVMGQDYMPARPALAAALVLGFAAIGSATPWLPFIGWIADTQGRETAMWVLAALPLAAAALAPTLPAPCRPPPPTPRAPPAPPHPPGRPCRRPGRNPPRRGPAARGRDAAGPPRRGGRAGGAARSRRLPAPGDQRGPRALDGPLRAARQR